MFNLVLFGPPGSGKGTQSEKLIAKYGFKHLSTGDLLRKEIYQETPLGLAAKAFIDKGELVPDEVVIGMISSEIEANQHVAGFLFDGFPRTVSQAEALDNLLDLKETAIHIMISLKVPFEELVKRLINRGKTSGRTDDTNESIINARIEEYLTKTAVVADFYNNQQKLQDIDGVGEVNDIFFNIGAAIDEKKLSL